MLIFVLWMMLVMLRDGNNVGDVINIRYGYVKESKENSVNSGNIKFGNTNNFSNGNERFGMLLMGMIII